MNSHTRPCDGVLQASKTRARLLHASEMELLPERCPIPAEDGLFEVLFKRVKDALDRAMA